MIHKIKVHCFTELRNENIEQIKLNCYSDFFYKVINKLILKTKPNEIPDYNKFNKNNVEFSLNNYTYFNDLGRQITINSKNCEFEETYFDLKEWFGLNLKDFDNVNCSPIANENLVREWLLTSIKEPTSDFSYYIYQAIFGLGEFPFLTIYISRIGNKRYYFYTIDR